MRLYAAGDIRVEEIAALDGSLPGWVRLRVTAAGICGSDIHNSRTGQWISRSPPVAGHEFAAVVQGCGEGVRAVSPGDTVVADLRFWYGECPACRAGSHERLQVARLPEAVAMLPEMAPRLARFIDRETIIDEIPDAYRRRLAGDAKGLKTIIRMA